MMDALARRLEIATQLAAEAGALAMRMRPPPGGQTGTLKGPQDWVTEADAAVEQFLSSRLAQAFPEDGFQGEEGGIARSGALRWVADPIDGTANFARGGNRFCISLGCLEDRKPLIGVIAAPALDETFIAMRGHGAHLNGAPVHAAQTGNPAHAIIEVGWSLRRSNQEFLKLCGILLDQGATLRHGGSGALALADVAAGRIDAYTELHINLWDVAAGLVILSEAGAAISPFMRGDGPVSGDRLLACAPGLAGALASATGIPLEPQISSL
jgi:myo-inositol-1(or 4)-monophosphatase